MSLYAFKVNSYPHKLHIKVRRLYWQGEFKTVISSRSLNLGNKGVAWVPKFGTYTFKQTVEDCCGRFSMSLNPPSLRLTRTTTYFSSDHFRLALCQFPGLTHLL